MFKFILVPILMLPISVFADGVVFASKEDIDSFDRMLEKSQIRRTPKVDKIDRILTKTLKSEIKRSINLNRTIQAGGPGINGVSGSSSSQGLVKASGTGSSSGVGPTSRSGGDMTPGGGISNQGPGLAPGNGKGHLKRKKKDKK